MAIDFFASEYGWTMDYIGENIGVADYFRLFQTASKRKKQEYLMQIAIARNPHVKNPDDLVKELQINEVPDYIQQETLDKAAFGRLKQRLSNNPHFIVK